MSFLLFLRLPRELLDSRLILGSSDGPITRRPDKKKGEPKLPLLQKRQRRYQLNRLHPREFSCPRTTEKSAIFLELAFRPRPLHGKNTGSIWTVAACDIS